MNNLLMFILACVGCTVTLVRADILSKPKQMIIDLLPRPLEKPIASLITCSQCLGFWVGIILSFLIDVEISGIIGVNTILLGFTSSYFSLLGDRVVYGIPEQRD